MPAQPQPQPRLRQGRSRSAAEARPRRERVVWLGDGLLNDHTDGHVDNLARFVAPGGSRSRSGRRRSQRGEVYADAAEALLDADLDVVLPLPGLVEEDGESIPASYMNFYIGNAVVVVPQYGAPNDAAAVTASSAVPRTALHRRPARRPHPDRRRKLPLHQPAGAASGTSSASTKLIHGGLRYLEHFEFGLVRESLKERETLWRIAPHVISPLRFVLPHHAGLRPRWLLRTGLWIYDHLGGRRLMPDTRSIDLGTHPAGAPLKPGFVRGWEYSDASVDDARLVILNARDAADRGATILTRHRLTRAGRTAEGWRLDMARDDGSHGTYYARALVNAAGPAVLDVLSLVGARSTHRVARIRGSHIVVPRLFDHGFAYLFQLADKRICFAIPYERDFTLIGTTESDHGGPLDRVEPTKDEIDYLCVAANDYFRRAISAADVVWSFAGVRALIDPGDGRPEAASRGYRIELDAPRMAPAPLLSILAERSPPIAGWPRRPSTPCPVHRPVQTAALDRLGGAAWRRLSSAGPRRARSRLGCPLSIPRHRRATDRRSLRHAGARLAGQRALMERSRTGFRWWTVGRRSRLLHDAGVGAHGRRHAVAPIQIGLEGGRRRPR
jgi:hypothetical protein